LAPGVTVKQVVAATAAKLIIPEHVPVMAIEEGTAKLVAV
jgi:acyl CoA:acetate/3-ketoacid CoA transferase beta subunit